MGKPKIQSNIPKFTKVELDWKAYFIVFCEKHGEPVKYKGRLLFRDGWGYSASEYEGPEFPPPASLMELDVLTEKYWTIRQKELGKLITALLHEKDQLHKFQSQRDVPIQRVTSVMEDGKKRRGYQAVDLRMLDQKIEWVEADLIECDEQLQLIKKHRGKKII